MELTDEEKKALMDEAIEKAKAVYVKEAKADIEKINKLIKDQRGEYDKLLEGKKTEADFKTYEEKSLEAEKAMKKRVDEIETKMSRLPIETPGTGEEKEVKAGQNEYKAAFFNFMRSGEMKLDDAAVKYIAERRALVSDDTGRILIPVELESEIYRSLPKINIIRALATVRTITREKIRRRSLTEVTMGWGKLELGGAPSETDVVPSEDYQWIEDLEGLARIGKDELTDTDISLESIIVDSFSRAKAETEEKAYVIGTGHANQQPDGILNGATVTRVKTAAADAIAADDLLDLVYAVPAQYRRNGKILVPSTTELAMRKLKSAGAEALYLWQPNVQAGQPATFAGYPVMAQEDVPAIGSADECDIAIFGDIKAGYRIVDRQGMTIQRLLELWATAGLVGILVSSRVTGGVIRADALRVLREHA
ncbi:MAG: phage major capsid protein [Candidatus Aminicenantes bacterium]|nr:phage major capsid protein [Candidatus Aminicenantes bacterium]